MGSNSSVASLPYARDRSVRRPDVAGLGNVSYSIFQDDLHSTGVFCIVRALAAVALDFFFTINVGALTGKELSHIVCFALWVALSAQEATRGANRQRIVPAQRGRKHCLFLTWITTQQDLLSLCFATSTPESGAILRPR
jgi:hypothetical protein